jgi:hypothetical protein
MRKANIRCEIVGLVDDGVICLLVWLEYVERV